MDATQLTVVEVFNNPMTTESTASFELRTYSDSTKSRLLDYQNTDLEIRAAVEPLSSEHSTIQAARDGTGVVGAATKTVLNLMASVPLPRGTIITIDFPIFNPEASPSDQKSYFKDPYNPVCNDKSGRKLACTLELDREDFEGNAFERLEITDALPRGLSRGNTVSIQLESLFNPLSLKERYFATALAVKSSRDGLVYNIESGFTSFKATKPAAIVDVKVTASTTTVQEYAKYTINFSPDVEIEMGSYVMVQFPRHTQGAGVQDYEFDLQLTTMRTSLGIFVRREVE